MEDRFFFVNSFEGWDFETKPKVLLMALNNEEKYVLLGDRVDFDRLVAFRVGEKASDIAELLGEDCLRLADVGPSACLGRSATQCHRNYVRFFLFLTHRIFSEEGEMVKPVASKIHELAQKKRSST